jgi:hypothetical protein
MSQSTKKEKIDLLKCIILALKAGQYKTIVEIQQWMKENTKAGLVGYTRIHNMVTYHERHK